MLSVYQINKILLLILIILVFVFSLITVISIQFQNKKNKKYQECLKLIEEKQNGILDAQTGINKDDIIKIDKTIDVDKLMMKLYDTYLSFINKLNNNDKSFDGILDGFIKEYYQNKIDIYTAKNHFEIIDKIELISYSILEFTKNNLKFRINITCFDYKKRNEEIISGSNLERVEQILIITYNKQKRKWLISNIEKVFEKKLSM